METILGVATGCVMLVLAGMQAWMQWRRWQILWPTLAQDVGKTDIEAQDRQYARRQVGRRFQVSVLLATLGLGIALGTLLPPKQWPTAFVLLWCGLAVLTFWVCVLALGDLLSLRVHGARLAAKLHSDKARLEVAVRKARGDAAAPQNGHGPVEELKPE